MGVSEALLKLAGVVAEKLPIGGVRNSIMPAVAPLALAQKQLDLAGITAEQASGYRGKISQTLFNSITPWGYSGHEEEIKTALKGILTGNVPEYKRMGVPDLTGKEKPIRGLASMDDAWALYLGLPQKHGTFSISKDKPTIAKDKNKTYYNINNMLDRMIGLDDESTQDMPANDLKQIKAERFKGLLQDMENSILDTTDPSGLLYHFHLSKGQDERGPYVSYHDTWDLDPNPMEADKRIPTVLKGLLGSDVSIGKPFEVYGRIHYDPKTFEPLDK